MCRAARSTGALLAGVVACGIAVLGAADAQAIVIVDSRTMTPDPDLFPLPLGQYVSTGGTSFATGSWDAEIVSMTLTSTHGRASLSAEAGGLSHIDSFFDVFVELGGGGQYFVESFFDVFTELSGRPTPGTTSGDWVCPTEMVQLEIEGIILGMPLMLRESPTMPSAGRHEVTDLGGGLYQIDSFFDVFTELSVDGGQNWIPASAPIHLELTRLVPEPATLSLLALGGLALLSRRRRPR